jgi:hypothetical protein
VGATDPRTRTLLIVAIVRWRSSLGVSGGLGALRRYSSRLDARLSSPINLHNSFLSICASLAFLMAQGVDAQAGCSQQPARSTTEPVSSPNGVRICGIATAAPGGRVGLALAAAIASLRQQAGATAA